MLDVGLESEKVKVWSDIGRRFYRIFGMRNAPGIPASVVANWALLA